MSSLPSPPEFTNVQSIEAVMAAISDIATGKSEEECRASAQTAIRTVKNSNSMLLAEKADKDIELQKTLTAAEDQAADNQVGAPPIADDTDAVNDDTDGAEPVPF